MIGDVALFGRAWIEINSDILTFIILSSSLSSGERELKLYFYSILKNTKKSLSSGERELK